MTWREALLTAALLLALASTGCVADQVDEDGPVGQLLGVFGNFSSEGNTTSYEFSTESLTDNTVMAPIQDTVDSFRNNVSEREGVEMKSTTVELVNVSSDSVTVRVDYRIDSEEEGTFDRNVTFTMVRRDGAWVLKDPFAQNLEGRELYQNPRN